jgi:hypothetical protein
MVSSGMVAPVGYEQNPSLSRQGGPKTHGAIAAKVASMQVILVPRSAAHPDNKNGTASFPLFLNLGPKFAAKPAGGKKLALWAGWAAMTAGGFPEL